MPHNYVSENEAREKLLFRHNGNIIMSNYTRMKNPCDFECLICGYKWSTIAFLVVREGNGCLMCHYKKMSEKYRLSLEYVREYIESQECLLLSDEYINSKQKLKIQFSCGHIGEIVWDSFKAGNRCRKCGYVKTAQKKTKTLDMVESELFKMHDSNIQIRNYCGMDKKADFKCIICGYEWTTYAASVITSGKGCKICSFKNISGNKSPNWKGGKVSVGGHFRRIIRNWRKESIKLNNSLCIITGNKAEVVHHLYSFREIILEAFDNLKIDYKFALSDYNEEELKIIDAEIINVNKKHGDGIPLTKKVHEKFHLIYSAKKFKPEDFYDFQRKVQSGEIQL